MVNIIKESFKLNISVLSAVGLYPSERNKLVSRIKMHTFYWIFMAAFMVLIFANILLKRGSDIMQMNLTVMYFLEGFCFCFKLLPFLTKGDRIKNCINYFNDSRFVPKDVEETNIINECISICKRNSSVFCILIVISYCLWLLPLLVAKDYKLPIDVWLPYDFKANSVVFYATFLYVCIAFVADGFVGSMVDPLIGGLAYHATGRLKILKYNLQHFDRDVKTHTIGTIEELYINLKRCIEHHNDILNQCQVAYVHFTSMSIQINELGTLMTFCYVLFIQIFSFVSEYENCFSWSVFCQFTGSLLTLSFSLIGLILGSTTSIDGTKNLITIIIIPFQIFFYCYYGTLLFEENNGLGNAVYMSHWYKYDINIRKILIVIMERSKRPLIVTSGKVVSLTLQTFVSVIKTSYSLIAVFNNY